jgi:hypothetical protein
MHCCFEHCEYAGVQSAAGRFLLRQMQLQAQQRAAELPGSFLTSDHLLPDSLI